MRKTLLLLMFFLPVLLASGQTDVLTRRNNNMRTGQNTSETILTPSNVNWATFGKLFSLPTFGQISTTVLPARLIQFGLRYSF